MECLLEEKLGVKLKSLPMYAANRIGGIRLLMLDVYACVNHTKQLAILDAFQVEPVLPSFLTEAGQIFPVLSWTPS